MKNFFLFLCLFLTFCFPAFSQVGIGTTNPQADLHVAGEMLVQENFTITELPDVTASDEDFKLLTRVSNSNPVGKIAVMDIDNLTVAPINVVNYTFSNIEYDNLTNVNLQYDADKYVLGIANFRHTGAAVRNAVVDNNYNTRSIGAFVVRAFIDGDNKWHLEIRNRFRNTTSRDSGIQYFVTLIVYDKSYYKNLPSIQTDLGGSNSGTASSVPILY